MNEISLNLINTKKVVKRLAKNNLYMKLNKYK